MLAFEAAGTKLLTVGVVLLVLPLGKPAVVSCDGGKLLPLLMLFGGKTGKLLPITAELLGTSCTAAVGCWVSSTLSRFRIRGFFSVPLTVTFP